MYQYTANCPNFIMFSTAEPEQIIVDPYIYIELPNTDSSESTVLRCDRKLGSLVQRYSVQWYRQFQNRRIVYDDEEGFELTLNVNSSLNGSQHFCVVTVNHDGSQTNIRNYSGGIITVVAGM